RYSMVSHRHPAHHVCGQWGGGTAFTSCGYLRLAVLSNRDKDTAPHLTTVPRYRLVWLALSYPRSAIGACGDNGCEWEVTPSAQRSHSLTLRASQSFASLCYFSAMIRSAAVLSECVGFWLQ